MLCYNFKKSFNIYKVYDLILDLLTDLIKIGGFREWHRVLSQNKEIFGETNLFLKKCVKTGTFICYNKNFICKLS